MSKKSVVNILEFRGGYSLVSVRDIESILVAFKNGKINKDALRVFAAQQERAALHEKSKVDIDRILNCKADRKGVKRLRRGVIEKVCHSLHEIRKAPLTRTTKLKGLSRSALRAIAQGRLTCTESIVLLMYFLRRIRQIKQLKRLENDERYARFTYGELEKLSGISRANISRAVASLKAKGWLSTVWVAKPNENQFGLLFVDGMLLTLIPGATTKDRSRVARKEVNKTATPPAQNSNSPVIELPTLRKENPKREIEKGKQGSVSKGFKSDWDRILERARLMKENFEEQAA